MFEVIFSMLGFGIQRSQSAVQSITAKLEQRQPLACKHVRLDSDRYAIWWGLTHSKGDPFNQRKGKDGIHWIPTAGCRGSGLHHNIDIVALYLQYCKLMGFTTATHGKKFRQQQDAPFFQTLDKQGRPTGQAMDYNSTLEALKTDITEDFPELDAAEYGLHSFRRFGATYARVKGIPDDLIKHMGGWVSDCFRRYFMFSDDQKVDNNRGILV
jgi:hypothetical protein